MHALPMQKSDPGGQLADRHAIDLLAGGSRSSQHSRRAPATGSPAEATTRYEVPHGSLDFPPQSSRLSDTVGARLRFSFSWLARNVRALNVAAG